MKSGYAGKELLAEFIKNAEAAGSKVFLAKDTKEANDYVINLGQTERSQTHCQIQINGI